MYITEVIPLIKNAPSEPLSYYTSQDLAVGSIVFLPIRKKTVQAVVLSQEAAPLSKLTLKAASFRLRKLPPQKDIPTLPTSILNLAETLSQQNPYPLGTLLKSLIPNDILDGSEYFNKADSEPSSRDGSCHTTLLADVFAERLRTHKVNIRETFAHHGSVLIVAPTNQEAEVLYEELKVGLEKRTILFTPARTKKQRSAAYTALRDDTQTKLIITTPQYIGIPRKDITHLILENSRSSHYIQKQKPYINFKQAALLRAHLENLSVTIADILPLAEDEWRRREGIYEPSDQSLQRLTFSSAVRIITPLKKSKKAFEPLYEKSVALLEKALAAQQRVFVYAARRGMAPMIICRDCSHIFRCPSSGAPYSLFSTGSGDQEKRWFVSASGSRVRAFDVCTECGSWRLQELGVGIQKIEECLRKSFPTIPIILFDHTTATTPRRRLQLMAEFYDTKNAILLGTAMAIPYITEPIDTTVVTSLEALRANPTWRAEEEALALLLTLRDKTTDTLLLQTKHEAEEELVSYVKNGQIEKFYDEELALREQLHYPPFHTFIHFMFAGNKLETDEIESTLKELLSPQEVKFYSSPTSTHADMTRFGLLRIEKSAWPDTALLTKLRSLPPYIRIEINPERLV